ncbi:endothelial lipase [Leptonychotes weddellii]|uniref:Endothelial lipase n=1 Tax=Leptonychotes weddellii TaxID=9713 RepID=A0A7F8RCF3_LEPWE|nr:endothelial lipase [Leptonychotes weddellii]
MRNSVPLFCLWSVYCCFAAGSSTPPGPEGWLREEHHKSGHIQVAAKSPVRFNLRTSGDSDHEGCYLSLGHNQPLEDCGFNMTAKTFFIIHGWTMSGMFESWLYKLVSALQIREKEANVVVVDWLPLAHQLYTDAVNNTRVVGHSVARMLDWLQEKDDFSLGNVHLIGYSLGAHVAGYAGNFVKGTVGRITGRICFLRSGLTPKLPQPPCHAGFSELERSRRGSTREPWRVSFGTNPEARAEGGWRLGWTKGTSAPKNSMCWVTQFELGCPEMASKAHKGLCSAISAVYHYQMKIHIFSYKTMGEIEPNFYVTLYGTSADSQLLPLEIVEQIGLNATNTFLVYTEEDLGDLLKIKLTWEGTAQSWYNLWKELRSYLSQPHSAERELSIRRIRVKSGETQRRLTFCVQDLENTSISPGQELWFHKCRDGWRMKNETRLRKGWSHGVRQPVHPKGEFIAEPLSLNTC